MAEVAAPRKSPLSLASLPVLRPVATAMFFLAVVVLGLVGIDRMPAELFPQLEGDQISVSFSRQGSTPEVVEREILIPLNSHISGLGGVKETIGQIYGEGGNLSITFDPGTDTKIREYEIIRITSNMVRMSDNRNTRINVSRFDTSAFGSFVMMIHVLGGDRDADILFDLAQEQIAPRLASVPGIAQAQLMGGGGRQVTISVDPTKAASLGVSTEEITGAISRKLGRTQYVGNVESEDGRVNVVLDGQVDSLGTLRQTRVRQNLPLTIDHVSESEIGYGMRETLFRINGSPAVGMQLNQEQGANIIEIGRAVRQRIKELRPILQSVGLDLVIGFDASESMDDQLGRLIVLGLSGFGIALLVLFLFLRQLRAVAVVGIAVPVSLMTALSALYVLGYSINILTLFGLAMSVGLLVDNSVVVYEAILRSIERGGTPSDAARIGLRKTVRAIVAASATTVVVFLPVFLIDLGNPMFKQLMEVIAISVVLPIAASLLVALGLVPLLAHRLAAPAAVKRVADKKRKREQRAGLIVPDRMRVLLSGLVANALRFPASWLAATVGLVVSVLIALAMIAGNSLSSGDAPQADSIQFTTRVTERNNVGLDTLASYVQQIEADIMAVEGVDMVETTVSEEQAMFSVQFVDRELRPADFSPSKVRQAAWRSAERTAKLDMMSAGEGEYSGSKGRGYQGFFGGTGNYEVTVTGPDSSKLMALCEDIKARLSNVNYVQSAWIPVRPTRPELWVEPNHLALEAFGMTAAQALPYLNLAGSRGQTLAGEFALSSGREIPVVVEREGARDETTSRRDLSELRINVGNAVLPAAAFSELREMPAPPVIVHRNGRREMKVTYNLSGAVPDSGQARAQAEEEVKEFIRNIPRPEGYVIDQTEDEEQTERGLVLLGLALLLLFIVLAVTFESLVLPFLVLLAIPLTMIGASWGLALTGTGLAPMVWAGMLVLAGLMVNPAIILVDRMQQLVRKGFSTGAAAYTAVKERTRPVLMTTATTVAALWPLALATGAENEIWPPFAIVVMTGLVSAALLTLIIMPVGYVLLRKLDLVFERVGAWLAIGWIVSIVVVMMPFVLLTDLEKNLIWMVLSTILVACFLLALVVLMFRRVELPEPELTDGTPSLKVTYLSKVYGLPGPVRKTLNAPKEFAMKVVSAGGKVFTRGDTFERSTVFLILAAGAGTLGWITPVHGWTLIFWLIATAFLSRICAEIRKFRGLVTSDGKAERGGIEGFVAMLLPWLTLAGFIYWTFIRPQLNDEETIASWFWPILAAVLLAIGQSMRRNAVRQGAGELAERVTQRFMRHPRTWWRRMSRRLGGIDLPADEVRALWSVEFEAKRGMIGILGPNGAGKTTLLRQLAGIINPTRGNITIGGVPLKALQNVLARWVGYLPQDAGLPLSLTPREYLQYYAALYDIPVEDRTKRVEDLIEEVGLATRIDDKIGSLSGGMKQRVAVARTLLRLPPIIIVDEPTVGLDPRERIRFRNLLARLAETRIVLFSTHVVEDVAISCERVLVMAKSRLCFDGSPSELAFNATGKVWEKIVAEGGDKALPEGAILAEESPMGDGATLQRIIWDQQPGAEAEAAQARPEDGYLWLLATT